MDGGGSRRSIVRRSDGTFAMAGRDSVLTLCDGTDRGFASFDDGTVVGPTVLQSNNLTLACVDGASVLLHVRYDLVRSGLLIEVTTRPDGSPVSTIVFHKVSLD